MRHNNLAFILYSHSSLKWIWNAFVGEQEQYFPIDCNKYVFTDLQKEEEHPALKDYEYVEYFNEWCYADRLLKCLQQVEEDFVLIHHEDMIFMDHVDMNMFEYYMSIMRVNKQFAYLKLLRGGISQSPPQMFASGLYVLQEDEQYKFAVQPAIWRKSVLMDLLKNCPDHSIYDLEQKANQYMIDNKIQSLFAYDTDEDSKRGLYHWDNSKYPFIATALIKGKWNDSEYDMEIENLKRSYDLK